MYRYGNSNVYKLDTEFIKCPSCNSRNLELMGECGEGCCTFHRCNSCNYEFIVEWPSEAYHDIY